MDNPLLTAEEHVAVFKTLIQRVIRELKSARDLEITPPVELWATDANDTTLFHAIFSIDGQGHITTPTLELGDYFQNLQIINDEQGAIKSCHSLTPIKTRWPISATITDASGNLHELGEIFPNDPLKQ